MYFVVHQLNIVSWQLMKILRNMIYLQFVVLFQRENHLIVKSLMYLIKHFHLEVQGWLWTNRKYTTSWNDAWNGSATWFDGETDAWKSS